MGPVPRGERMPREGGIPAGPSVRARHLQLPSCLERSACSVGTPCPSGASGGGSRVQPGGCCPEPGRGVWPGTGVCTGLPFGAAVRGCPLGLGGTLSAAECKWIQDQNKTGRESGACPQSGNDPPSSEASEIALGAEPEQGCPGDKNWGEQHGQNKPSPRVPAEFPRFCKWVSLLQPLEAPWSSSGLRAGVAAEVGRTPGTLLSQTASPRAGESRGDLQRWLLRLMALNLIIPCFTQKCAWHVLLN